ncbi:exonuclease domain-containing protein [Nonomuraea sp. B12E4]|uniref:exonuclease domain-containing protein n=1 Tax=Nonomuraea sp. B12E4 TaxID=3153564 RepID=UPI00325E4DB4
MATAPHGYAVIDTETTGLRPAWHDRIIEMGVVHLDAYGEITREWVTLVNPGRDLWAWTCRSRRRPGCAR